MMQTAGAIILRLRIQVMAGENVGSFDYLGTLGLARLLNLTSCLSPIAMHRAVIEYASR